MLEEKRLAAQAVLTSLYRFRTTMPQRAFLDSWGLISTSNA